MEEREFKQSKKRLSETTTGISSYEKPSKAPKEPKRIYPRIPTPNKTQKTHQGQKIATNTKKKDPPPSKNTKKKFHSENTLAMDVSNSNHLAENQVFSN